MDRRSLLRRLGFVASLCFTAAVARGTNVVFIMADDLGWRDTTPYGSTFYKTPNVERLAKSGLRFTDAYSANPLCSPTRASVLTGQYPGRLGFTTPGGHLPRAVLSATMPKSGPPDQPATNGTSATRLRNETQTLGEIFKANGFRTAFMGKWHLGSEPYIPEAHGFDVVVGGREDPGPPAPGHYFAPWNRDTLPKVPPGTHVSDVVTDEAIKFVKDAPDKPFFLCLWYYDVHAPYQGKPELMDEFERRVDPKDPQRQPVMGAMIETMDTNLGRLLDALDEQKLADDTVVVFYSDNGGNMYDRPNGMPPTSNAPLRGGKAMSYEGGVRVPLIVRWPGLTKAGQTSAALVTSPDFLPTLVEGLPLKASVGPSVDGVSFVSALAGEAFDRGPIFCHFPHYIGNQNVEGFLNRPSTTVRRGNWKLFRYYADGPEQADRYELYDLSSDIGEAHDVASAHPDLVRELSNLIDEHLAKTDAIRPTANPDYRAGAADAKPKANAAPAAAAAAEGDAKGWQPGPNRQAKLRVANGRLVVESSGVDPFILTSDVESPAGEYVLVVKMTVDAPGKGKVYFTSHEKPRFNNERSADFDIQRDGKPHEYRVPFKTDEALNGIRLDPAQGKGRVEIDSIRLESKDGKVVKDWTFGDAKD